MIKREPSSSRSAQVREKRRQTKGKVKPLSQRQKNLGDRQGMPPVMVRGSSESDPVRRSRPKAKRVKRRYDIAMPTPGVEIRLPSIPEIKVSWRLLSFLLILVFSSALYYLFSSPIYRVQNIEMDGGVYLSAESLHRMLLVDNKPIFMIEPQVIADQLVGTLDGLLSASVSVNFPAQVTVTVEERTPVLIWEMEGTSYWVDAQGYSFPPRGEATDLIRVVASALPPAPITLEGVDDVKGSQQLMMPDMIAAIVSLRNYAPDGIQILYDAEHGFGWFDPHGWSVYFGMKDTDVKVKLAVYDTLLRRLNQDGIQPAMISVEYLHAPFYRLEP